MVEMLADQWGVHLVVTMAGLTEVKLAGMMVATTVE